MTVFHRMGTDGPGEQIDAEVSHEFLDRIPGGVFRYRADDECALDYVNNGLIRMFGCRDYEEFLELTGNTFPGMVMEEDRERVMREIQDQMRLESEDRVRFRIKRKNGEVRWIEDNGHYIVDSTGVGWFYVTLLDVTEEVRLREALAEANEKFEVMAMLGTYQRRAEIDGLTGVLNRTAGVARIVE
ncbi:PAS domain-containing protein [Olsenella sp. YH-ols2217]|uniref:histidine kinase n=1 Tax=Kribbibacterium absianum TaxID=3044210 RepID=A0ABT6ZJ92_9ACTN|nr:MULTISPECIES: PAS domain-containing protein [unclassified Olsenella]MDJ1122687.1 PAS domain-containing protein [Olsenella sp. YH-ols2216]MDJ1129125.1 PAS domain-containing protein [Olsenella sp. YH-ols2217]